MADGAGDGGDRGPLAVSERKGRKITGPDAGPVPAAREAAEEEERMDLLVTLDQNYLGPLRVLLGSLFLNDPGEEFHIYMIEEGLTGAQVEELSQLCRAHHSQLHPLEVPDGLFTDAPVVRYYSRAMYYRLLAAELLPRELDRVLYLDPDILVIRPVRPLYETQLGDSLLAAASHSGLTGMSDYVNKIRLSNYEAESYYNSGVLLMNLPQMREEMRPADIFAYAREYEERLILPDQDILNGLYGTRILGVDDSVWNYDARRYDRYWLGSHGEKDMDWVMDHTVFLHFCGKNKPWSRGYEGHFSALYKHYQRLLGEV